MQNALIYSFNFDGHRQVYVYVIAHILNKLGYNLIVVGNFSANLNNSFYLDKLDENNSVIKIDTFEYAGFGMNINNHEFIELQEKYDINLTVFAEADNHIPLLISQLLPDNKRFHGQIVGIFLRPWYFYKKLSVINKLRYIKDIRKNWKSDKRLFNEVLVNTFNLLDFSMHIDENYVAHHKKCIWLPDVFQQFTDKLVLNETSDQRIWIERLNIFIKANKDRFVLLYFGTAQHRRGYDELLKLASDQKLCFVHCGLRNDEDEYIHDVNKLRESLTNDNRLFETNQYITDPYCIECFFKSISHLILPYCDFLGSSGVMLQALEYGIPVLVPDYGLMGYRVKKFNLGRTYSEESLEKQFLRFVEIPKDEFKASIDEYMKFQTSELLEKALTNAFMGIKMKSPHP